MSKIIHLVRHGEVYNPSGILYGRLPNFHLSDLGKNQAQMVAQWCAERNICYIGVSPLERAQETAQPISTQLSVPIIIDQNLIEGSSLFEGQKVSFGDGALSQPQHWWKLRNPFHPSWGEPYNQVANRMLVAINKARSTIDDGQEAVLVSHQLPVWIARLHLSGKKLWHNPAKRQCALASVTSYTFTGDNLVNISYIEPAGASDPRITGA